MGGDRMSVVICFLILLLNLTIAHGFRISRFKPYKYKPSRSILYAGPMHTHRRLRMTDSHHRYDQRIRTGPSLATILLTGIVHPNSTSVVYDQSHPKFSNLAYRNLNNTLCLNSKAAVINRADIYNSWYDCTAYNGTNSGHVATVIRFKRKQLGKYGLDYASPDFHDAIVAGLERNHSNPSTRSGFYYEVITDVENKSIMTVVHFSRSVLTLLGLAVSRMCLEQMWSTLFLTVNIP
ncbi:hypothetical protein P879_04512 [Paragonimus westermani]|uniref:Uncharacterized protein n=1 Tax=Paragonimus westermani TaxID=34504 RepID=A0A8T0CXW2_9TREM|nr:hypothetical protein P879_04512 [Paragonimus westermani]